MNMTFDIAEDELKIFLAESDEQLQMLDEGLVRLEREGDDMELLQAIFRAAHTLKGSAGAIGHRRMAELTHAMETALDGLRKHTLHVTPALVDACLESLDALRLLLNEVVEGEASPMDINPLVKRLSGFVAAPAPTPAPAPAPVLTAPARVEVRPAPSAAPTRARPRPVAKVKANVKTKTVKAVPASKAKAKPKVTPKPIKKSNGKVPVRAPAQAPAELPPATTGAPLITINAEISPTSIASAARAFQMMLALQELGEIVQMNPSQAQIETAAPVHHFSAQLASTRSTAEIHHALTQISEVDRVSVQSEAGTLATRAVPEAAPEAPSAVALETPAAEPPPSPSAEPSAARPMAASPALTQARVAEKTVRTSVERLDNLMNLVGELITDRNRLNQLRGDYESRFRGDEQVDNLVQTVVHIGRITDQLQEEVMRIRMLPIANVFNKFPRLVRDLARKANKPIELVLRGEDTELDRSVIEEIGDPLIHLLRNSVDHGIETPAERLAVDKPEHGTIFLTARHEESRIILTVEDDGRGIDSARVKASAVQKGLITEADAAAMSREEAIDLIFRSGLSTAKTVSDISGRGVGMDIVRTNIERLNGSVIVETWAGKGTRFQIVLPLTLAIIPTLLVKVDQSTYAIPLATVMEALRIMPSEIQTISTRPAIKLRGHVLPLVRLRQALGFPPATHTQKYEYVVAVRWGKLEMGLIVDTLIGEQEMVVKSLGALVGEAEGISGAAILGDGRVALIVDVPGLFKLSGA